MPHFNALARGDPLPISPLVIYHQKLDFLVDIFAAESIDVSPTTFTQSILKATEFGKITQKLGLLRRSRSFKVTDFDTNRKLICDFLLLINSNLPPILHRFQVMVQFSLTRGECLTLMLSLGVIPYKYCRKWCITKTWFCGLHFYRIKYQCISNHFYAIRSESYRIRWNYAAVALLRRSRSSKVTEFGTNRKLICDFLLVINSNSPSILHRFRDIALERWKIATFFYASLV